MAQNIYDDPRFFAAYNQLPRSVEGLAGAPEWASIRALLPDLNGRRVVDLGCGFGWFARWACEHGAASVLGLDISDNMLARARAETPDGRIRYETADLDCLQLPAESFDFAFSSLALHYVVNFTRLIETVHRALTPGASFVFNIEHPIFMAPDSPGWMTLPDERKVWPLNGYSREGQRTTDWLAPGVVKQHRTLGTTLNTLIGTGFNIRHVEEWRPTAEQLARHPEWAGELDLPTFLIIAAQK